MLDHAAANETVRFKTSIGLPKEFAPAVAGLLRRAGIGHAFSEIIEPLAADTKVMLSLALVDRPWPPRGVDSVRAEAMSLAVIADNGRAMLTPVIADLAQATNVGLQAAVTKHMLEGLAKHEVTSISYLVREGAGLTTMLMKQGGFEPGQLRAATEYAEFLEYTAKPHDVLEHLGLAKIRLGDLLALKVEPAAASRLALHHLGLAAAVAPYFHDRISAAELLPGLVDWAAISPPGGISGTAGPHTLPGERQKR